LGFRGISLFPIIPRFHYSIIPFLDSLRALHPLGLSFLFRIPNSTFRIGEASMALLTGKEYVESLKEFSPEVYIRGEKVHRALSPLTPNSVRATRRVAPTNSELFWTRMNTDKYG
jgi:hypothetical protein